ncbi:MAG: glutamate--tRNA ligase, partial [Candidatus Omnitrophica bacterium]|nr:glutamate--tRNA ligase [Candidatus Omnitrophota bacterium]
MSSVRVRFAPSPTGFLHIGSVRTALFNYLFARSQGGEFHLRIEDTDRERSKPEFEAEILKSLEWLGFRFDGPVLRQSERFSLYSEAAEKLAAEGKAYVSTEKGGRAIVFKIPKVRVNFPDLVHGEINFDSDSFEDLVLIKSDGSAAYNFACVVDDHAMGITHVIRGDDHISNTPKQILLYQALGYPVPQFAHLPLIVGADNAPLSKRHGSVSLPAYQEEGFVAPAL